MPRPRWAARILGRGSGRGARSHEYRARTMRRWFVVAAMAAAAAAAPPPSSATVTEYPTCSLPPTADGALCEDGRSPNSIVAGPDGAMWFTTYGGGEVGRITIAGAITLYNVPRPAGESATAIRGPA